jgi:Protein of unknown function (DUF1064)
MYTQQNRYYTTKSVKGKDGKIYDSKFEAGYGEELRLRKLGKDIKDYSTQVNFPLIVNGYHVGVYIADFLILHNNGDEEIVETKGFPTPVFRLKWRLVEALYSDKYKVSLIMQGKGKLRHAKKIIEY